MGLLDSIKRDAKKSGGNKAKFMYFREGEKQRVRFLQDMDEGLEVVFHDSFEAGINVPCQELFGRECPYCEDSSLRTRSQYAWSVWNYESNQVQVFMFPMNNCSPLPALVAMYENYGTLMDRDYVISVSGKQQNKTFSVVPMDKVKFRNAKAKPFAKKELLKMLDKAWPAEDVDMDEDEDEEEVETTKRKKKNRRPKSEEDDEDELGFTTPNDDYDDSWDEDDDAPDYDSMSPKELFNLCKERKIKDVKPKKPKKYYINLLEEYDAAQDDWGDDDDDDDWEDDDE